MTTTHCRGYAASAPRAAGAVAYPGVPMKFSNVQILWPVDLLNKTMLRNIWKKGLKGHFKFQPLKRGFSKKLLLYKLWPVTHFFNSVITFGWVCCCFAVAPNQKWWQNEKKWATGQSCIRKEVTPYKIHTLIYQPNIFNSMEAVNKIYIFWEGH